MAMNPRLLRPRATAAYDADAQVYFNAVATADGQQLEPAVKKAISDFVKGCKADGTWSAIKASCILMGARTLSGALTPLVGSAPTNNGPFVSGDYNRKTGLVGNGTTKYLDSGRANNADGQNDFHMSVYASSFGTGGASGASVFFMGWTTDVSPFNDTSTIGRNPSGLFFRNREPNTTFITEAAGFLGTSRSGSASHTARVAGANTTITATSNAPAANNLHVFQRNSPNSGFYSPSNARLAWYSIGSNVNLALLDSRVSALYTAISAAI